MVANRGVPRRKLWGAQRGTTYKKFRCEFLITLTSPGSRFPGSNLERAGSLVKCYTENTTFYGAEARTLHTVYHKYVGSFEMWCRRRIEISWTGRGRNEKVLHRVREERNILHTVKRRKANWICHILRRNCFIKHVIEGQIEGRSDGMTRKKT